MPRVEFEPMIPVLERPKTVHALDRAATVIVLLRHLVLERRVYRALKKDGKFNRD
jgi:hypothetical protein